MRSTKAAISFMLSELLEVQHGACRQLTKDDVSRVLERRRQVQTPPTPHRCAIIVSLSDERSWDLAKFYEGIVTLHHSESVIVFGDIRIARVWLGVEDLADTERVGSEKH
jgi:hypothetical protein